MWWAFAVAEGAKRVSRVRVSVKKVDQASLEDLLSDVDKLELLDRSKKCSLDLG